MIWRDWVIQARYRHVQRFVAETARSFSVQRQVLFHKLRRNADSDFGRRWRLGKIRSLADFRRLPITTFEDYRPFVERVKNGEVSAMFGPGTQVLMFSMTSGTTGQSKYIPITREFVAEYRKGWNLWGSAMFYDHRPLLTRWSVERATRQRLAQVVYRRRHSLRQHQRPGGGNVADDFPPRVPQHAGLDESQ
jgi:hypothetical protein